MYILNYVYKYVQKVLRLIIVGVALKGNSYMCITNKD